MNLALWGVPARIVWGDTLRQEIHAEWRTPFRAVEVEPDYRELLTILEEQTSTNQRKTLEVSLEGPEYDQHEGRLFA